MSNPQNPLWQVYNALWTLLEADAAFCLAVPAMNRIKYTDTTDRHPDKDNALDADFPMVRIRCLGGRPRAHRTSNSSMIELRWTIEIYTGDQRLATHDKTKVFDVSWAIWKALINWQTYLYDFTWNGNTFIVRYCRAAEITDELSHEDIQRKQLGWRSVWTGDTDVWFTTTDLTLAST